MDKNSNTPRSDNAQIQKENEDLPNLPASSEKIKSEEPVHKQVKKTSKLQKDGKTDNTERNSEN